MLPSCDFLPYWVAFFSGRLACQYRALVLLSFGLRKVILKKRSEVVFFSPFFPSLGFCIPKQDDFLFELLN